MKKKINIYTSRVQQTEEEIKYTLSISPTQRIKETVELIDKIYGKRSNSKKITITKRG